MFDQDFLSSLGVVKFGYNEESSAGSFHQFEKWVEDKDHGPLSYLADHRKDLRKNLHSFFPEFQSALVFLFDYSKEKKALDEFYQSQESNGLKISSYVFGFEGLDYHEVLRERLSRIQDYLLESGHLDSSTLETKISLDIHPVLERDLAHRSGVGWFGKNSMLINREKGSFVMLGSLLFNQKLDLPSSEPELDHCGNCTACIEACPTDALDPVSRTLKADKCISTWTIELFKDADPIPGHLEKSGGEIFGCDICQDVCPWNTKKLNQIISEENESRASKDLKDFFLRRPLKEILEELASMSNSKFRKRFQGTPLARTGRIGLLKNIRLFKKES